MFLPPGIPRYPAADGDRVSLGCPYAGAPQVNKGSSCSDRVSVKPGIVFLALALLSGASAQDRSWSSKTIELKYLAAEQLRRVFSGQSYIMEANYDLNLVTVRGPAAFITEVEETAKRLDIPPPVPANIEITVYLLATGPPAGALPPELAGLEKELKSMRVTDSQIIRVRSGTAGNANSLVSPSETVATLGSIRFQSALANGTAISLDGLQVWLNLPGKPTLPEAESGITADLDLLENQPAIVRKAGVEKPLIIVVRAVFKRI